MSSKNSIDNNTYKIDSAFHQLQQHTLILIHCHRRLLIDTGEAHNNEYLKNLAEVLRSNKTSISQVVLTHWHGDHIGGVSGVLNLTAPGFFFFFSKKSSQMPEMLKIMKNSKQDRNSQNCYIKKIKVNIVSIR